MADEADGVDEAFEASLRVGLTLAGRMAEQAARAHEQQTRELASRLDSESLAARAQLAATEHDQWWAAAEPNRIAEAWQTACSPRDLDLDAAAAADRIRTQVRDRYGVDIDIDEPPADAGALAEAIAQADRDAADRQRRESRRDQVEAAALMTEADRADHAQDSERAGHAERDADEAYDSAGRRRALAASLEGWATQSSSRPGCLPTQRRPGPPSRPQRRRAHARVVARHLDQPRVVLAVPRAGRRPTWQTGIKCSSACEVCRPTSRSCSFKAPPGSSAPRTGG